MLELLSLLRSAAFAILFAGIEYRYINRREAPWTEGIPGFFEKPVFWLISAYQAFLLFPLFISVALASTLTAWVGNTFLVAFLEDVAYFAWRGKWVKSGEWTTRLFGSFTLSGKVVPVWWPLTLVITVAFYLMPL